MMMRTAGGPGPISPIDFGERRKPLPRWMWGAIGVSALIHVGIGTILYSQRFELDIPQIDDDLPPPVVVTMAAPKPKPLPATTKAPAPRHRFTNP